MDSSEQHDLRGPARIAVVAAMTVIASFVACKAGRDAILLSNFSVERLPLFVATSAAISLPIVVVAGRMFARFGPDRLLPVLNVVSALLLVGEWVLLARSPQIAAVIVFLHLGSLGAVLVSGFWSIVNERFDVRSAKRYVGRIGVGATLGGIIGGVIAERTAVYLEPGAILLVLAGLQLVSAIAVRLLAGAQERRSPEPVEAARLSAVRTLARIPLLRNLGIVVVLGAVSAAALDYVFKAEVIEASDGSPLRLFALYHTATSILTAVIQIVIARLALTRLGIPRSVAMLPATVTGFGIAAVVLPGLYPALIARGAEAVTRSSVYRAGYELLFAPLPERDKRSTKVVLDVGAERLGDLLGAQLVAIILYTATVPREPVLIAATVFGVLGLLFAARLPRNYTSALELSLVDRAEQSGDGVALPEQSELAWSSFGLPTVSDIGADRTVLSLLDIPVQRPSMNIPPPSVMEVDVLDPTVERITTLRSRDLPRVRETLATGLTPDLVPHVIPLLAWNDVAGDAVAALSAIASRCTGALVDALLDVDQEFTIRRRLPAVLTSGEPRLAAWGLWRGLSDSRFEVRYRCGRALGELRGNGHEMPFGESDVHDLVDRELTVDNTVMQNYRLIDSDPDQAPGGPNQRLGSASPSALAHIFNLLGLALPPEPIRIAYQGLHTQDRELRATALEYLESALPHELSERLWPLIELERLPRKSARSPDELTAALKLSLPRIEAELAVLRNTGGF